MIKLSRRRVLQRAVEIMLRSQGMPPLFQKHIEKKGFDYQSPQVVYLFERIRLLRAGGCMVQSGEMGVGKTLVMGYLAPALLESLRLDELIVREYNREHEWYTVTRPQILEAGEPQHAAEVVAETPLEDISDLVRIEVPMRGINMQDVELRRYRMAQTAAPPDVTRLEVKHKTDKATVRFRVYGAQDVMDWAIDDRARFREIMESGEYVCFDDMGKEHISRNQSWRWAKWNQQWNRRYVWTAPTGVTTNLGLEAFEKFYGPRIKDLLREWGKWKEFDKGEPSRRNKNVLLSEQQ